jgi:transcriptional regulator with XRE-family HTH domain
MDERPPTLREWRARRALGMDDLAARAGVSKTTIIEVEHGRRTEWRRRTMRKIAEALDVEPWDIAEFRRVLEAEARENAGDG